VFPVTSRLLEGSCRFWEIALGSPHSLLCSRLSRIWSPVTLCVLYRCVRPLPDSLRSLSLPVLITCTAHAWQGRCSVRPRRESNRVYWENTACFAILFLDHLHCSVVQFSLIPSMVAESFFVLLWSWKLLHPEETDSQNNAKSSWMCLELCIFSSAVQQLTCEYSNRKGKMKGKQLCP